jgi:hypothetical protein
MARIRQRHWTERINFQRRLKFRLCVSGLSALQDSDSACLHRRLWRMRLSYTVSCLGG